mmetsp:Transcript_24065/g.51039  ORF Transcript_24065/g.51039 Transcript_24065/m.51039 type:complete len:243 (-) Transcript_24065:126-854(-)
MCVPAALTCPGIGLGITAAGAVGAFVDEGALAAAEALFLDAGLKGTGELEAREATASTALGAAPLAALLPLAAKLDRSILSPEEFLPLSLLEGLAGVGVTLVLPPAPLTRVMVTFLAAADFVIVFFLGAFSSSSSEASQSSSLRFLASRLSSSTEASSPPPLYSDPLSSPSPSSDDSTTSSNSISSSLSSIILRRFLVLSLELSFAALLFVSSSLVGCLLTLPPIILNRSVLKSIVSTSPSS